AAQPTFALTGGLHAAGLFDADGELLCLREDVGRHNALDKVVGWSFQEGRLPLAAGALCVSGRLSFELVQKAAVAGCPLLVAVGERLAVGKLADGLPLPFPLIDDGTDVRAPLAGLVAGLRAATGEICVFLPVDCPSVTAEVLRDLGEACADAAVPQTGPLPGA